MSIVTRSAAAFGLGYAATGGIAFCLSAAHAFRLSLFIPVWIAVSIAAWALALRRAALRDYVRGFADIAANRLPLLVGAVILIAYVAVHLKFLHELGASRYVYYLNGIYIANDGRAPASTLEYGQWWPPATDKIFLDDFTGLLVMLGRNVAIGPGVLLLGSIVGAGLGLWAAAWELGLRWTSVLVPVLVLSNQVIFNSATVSAHGDVVARRSAPVSTDFTEYHADDFGRAVAFCALALGIYALRKRKWGVAAAAGVVLAAAAGTHLIPVVVVVIALGFTLLAELIRNKDNRARLVTVRQAVVVATVSGVLAVLIRVFAGGSLGLAGASNPSGYAAAHTGFDPTYFLFTGQFMPIGPASGHWYVPPAKVVEDLTAGVGGVWPTWGLAPLYVGLTLAAVLLFVLLRDDLRTIGVVGLGTVAGLIGVAMLFSYRYQVYVDGTFGVRRLRDYASLGVILLGLGVVEAVILYLGRNRSRVPAVAAVAAVLAVSAWVLPASSASRPLDRLSRERITLTDWLRANTPCGARILVNQRTEGSIVSLTGRFALLEGMGPYLRVDKLPYVVNLFLNAGHFFSSPLSSEALLREDHISYVVLARRRQLLGYGDATGHTNYREMRAAPFLKPVLEKSFVIVYQVRNASVLPVSPLLKGPYLHCLMKPVHF